MTDFISTYGLTFIFVNVLLDQVGLPIPAIPTLIVAGALAADGKFPAMDVVIGAGMTTLATESAWFYAGRHYGNRVLKGLCRISLTPDSCVKQTQRYFERWGIKALIIANFIPGLSIVAPPLAGATHMRWPRFLILSAIGALLWIGVCISVGMIFKEEIAQLLILVKHSGTMVIIIICTSFTAYVVYKWWERRRFYAMLRLARINVDELYRLMMAGEPPMVIDVRSQIARSLEPSQIPGALHVPLDAVHQILKGIPHNRDIVFYCSCPNEVSAVEATKILIDHGIKRVRPLNGGLEAWIAAGYSVESIITTSP